MGFLKLIGGRSITVILIGAAVLIGLFSMIDLPGGDKSAPAFTEAGKRQLDRAASRLAEPGIFVAKSTPYSRVDGPEYQDLKEQIKGADYPVRVAILPESITRDGKIHPDWVLSQLHGRVDKPGVYAVLIDDQGSGTMSGRYWAPKSEDPEDVALHVDHARDAATDANECCARDYPKAISEFVDTATAPPGPWRPIVFWACLAILLGGFAWLVVKRRQESRMHESTEDAAALEEMRQVVREEMSDLSYRVAALPTAETVGDSVAGRIAKARELMSSLKRRSARYWNTQRRTSHDLLAIVQLFSDIRFELHAIEQMRLGLPSPSRTEPCFLDPQHGPSETDRDFAPPGLAERRVKVCLACANEIDGEQKPPIRRLPRESGASGSGWANYWEADAGMTYVDGYWGSFSFPDDEFEDSRVPHQGRVRDPLDGLKRRLATEDGS
ncbi:MAG: hypothetical protein ACRCYQ_05860 [Nocardioides sp.]